MNKISIITPSFNQGRFIERTIKSVLNQSLKPDHLEHIIFDGGSSDKTISILKKYSHLNWTSEPDSGQSHAINKGFKIAKNDIIGWLNSDDIYDKDAFKHVFDFFKNNPKANIVYGLADHINTKDKFINEYPVKPFTKEKLFEQCFICQPAVFFRKKIIKKYGLLDESLNFCMDYEYWLRIVQKEKFYLLNHKLAYSRLYKSNKTLKNRSAVSNEICIMIQRFSNYFPGTWFSSSVHISYIDLMEMAKNNFILKHFYFLLKKNKYIYLITIRVIQLYIFLKLIKLNTIIKNRYLLYRITKNVIKSFIFFKKTRKSKHFKISFDCSQINSLKTGTGNYANHLLENLYKKLAPKSINCLDTFGYYIYNKENLGTDYIWNKWFRDDLDKTLNSDFVQSNNFWVPLTLNKTKLIYTFYDDSFLANHNFSTKENFSICSTGIFHASLSADYIITISNFSKSVFLKLFPYFPKNKIVVVYPSSPLFNSSLLPKKPNLNIKNEMYFLTVGTVEPRKNHEFILKIFHRFLKRYPHLKIKLVIAGAEGWLIDLKSIITKYALEDNVIHAGYTSSSELKWLYKNAAVNIYPSLYEGFGIPVIEGYKFNVPTMCSKISVFQEITGPDNDLSIDLAHEEKWIETLYKLTVNNDFKDNILRNQTRLFQIYKKNLDIQLNEYYNIFTSI